VLPVRLATTSPLQSDTPVLLAAVRGTGVTDDRRKKLEAEINELIETHRPGVEKFVKEHLAEAFEQQNRPRPEPVPQPTHEAVAVWALDRELKGPDLITRARKLLADATPGPWDHRYENGGHGVFFGNTKRVAFPVSGRGNGGAEEEHANAALIAAAPTLITELADALEVARRCRRCKGSGIAGMSVDYEEMACRDCNGTGFDR
jgi:hypothetical protein